MSIINDALKKTQENLNKNNQTVNHHATTPTPQAETDIACDLLPTDTQQTNKKKTRHKALPLILLYGAFVLIISGLSSNKKVQNYFMKMSQQIKSAPVTTTVAVETTPTQQPPTIIKPKNANLHFNGTMKIDEKIVALINDDVFEEGEMVENNEIIKITLKELTIKNPMGEISKLRVK